VRAKTRLRTRDFDRIHRQPARRERSRRFQVLARPNGLARARWGISVKARLGNAVTRNRVKRRLREMLRRADLAAGWDLLVQPRDARVATADYAELERELGALLAKALAEEGG
jgi:ribonuclease P protein component